MSDGKARPVTKAMIYELAKAIESMLPLMSDHLRDIKEIIGRIEGHFQQIGC